MLPIRLLPRPSLLAGAVVATSIAGGLAFGVLAGGALVLFSDWSTRMIFFYLPGLGLAHFLSASALGFMSVLSGKALRDMWLKRAPDYPLR